MTIVNNTLQSSEASSSLPPSSPALFRCSSFLDLYQVRLRVRQRRGGHDFVVVAIMRFNQEGKRATQFRARYRKMSLNTS
jgi:hypothetical protein